MAQSIAASFGEGFQICARAKCTSSASEHRDAEAVVAVVAPVKPETTRWTMATTLTNGLPATHLFKTSEGGMGLLQITGFTDNPPGVKLRYKLVQ